MARRKIDQETRKKGDAFAKKLVAERKNKKLSQDELSRCSGVSLDTLRAIEKRRVLVPGLFIAIDLVHALGFKIDDWLKDKN